MPRQIHCRATLTAKAVYNFLSKNALAVYNFSHKNTRSEKRNKYSTLRFLEIRITGVM